jgi:hypothetical protein
LPSLVSLGSLAGAHAAASAARPPAPGGKGGRQIATLEKNFVEEGGFTERLYRVRSERRNRG